MCITEYLCIRYNYVYGKQYAHAVHVVRDQNLWSPVYYQRARAVTTAGPGSEVHRKLVVFGDNRARLVSHNIIRTRVVTGLRGPVGRRSGRIRAFRNIVVYYDFFVFIEIHFGRKPREKKILT